MTLNDYKNSGLYDDTKLNQITAAFAYGISEEWMDEIIKPEFSSDQLYEILQGLYDLDMDKVKIFANPKYKDSQMYEIRTGITSLNDSDKVLIYANPEFNYKQMRTLKSALISGLSEKELKIMANPKYTHHQMRAISSGFKKYHIAPEQILKYMGPEFNDRQLVELSIGLSRGFSTEAMELMHNTLLSHLQMKTINLAMEQGIPVEIISYFAKPEYDIKTINACISAYLLKLPITEIPVHNLVKYNSDTMSYISLLYKENFVPKKLLMDICFNIEELMDEPPNDICAYLKIAVNFFKDNQNKIIYNNLSITSDEFFKQIIMTDTAYMELKGHDNMSEVFK